jgi:hypothetical protein
MTVDDHAIDSLRTWFNLAYEELKKEWKSGQYGELIECPSFKATSAYREAMNILIEACYRSEYVDQYRIKSLEKRINDELEVEDFWEEK